MARYRDLAKVVDQVEGYPNVFIRRINIKKIKELQKLTVAAEKRAAKSKSEIDGIEDLLDVAKFMWKELIVDESANRFEDMIDVSDEEVEEVTDVMMIRQIMNQVLDVGEDDGIAQT